MRPPSVLFVCLGNICRSPMAEAVFLHMLAERAAAGKSVAVGEVDSAGTGNWHVGQGADPRTIAACQCAGISVSHTVRQVQRADFGAFDLIIAMDHDNASRLRAMGCPDDKLRLMRHYDPANADLSEAQLPKVPDPYHDDADVFDATLTMLRPACAGLIDAIAGMR